MKKKPYWEMKPDELRETTTRFDEGDAMAESRPLDAGDAEQWRNAKAKRGRPKVGEGHQRISVSIERGLLNRVNSFAKKKKLSRSQLFAELFERALAKEAKRSG